MEGKNGIVWVVLAVVPKTIFERFPYALLAVLVGSCACPSAPQDIFGRTDSGGIGVPSTVRAIIRTADQSPEVVAIRAELASVSANAVVERTYVFEWVRLPYSGFSKENSKFDFQLGDSSQINPVDARISFVCVMVVYQTQSGIGVISNFAPRRQGAFVPASEEFSSPRHLFEFSREGRAGGPSLADFSAAFRAKINEAQGSLFNANTSNDGSRIVRVVCGDERHLAEYIAVNPDLLSQQEEIAMGIDIRKAWELMSGLVPD